MLVVGLLTSTMFLVALDPASVMTNLFGEIPDSAAQQMVARNWGVLIGMVGLLLIYGAFKPTARRIAVLFATISKLAFIALAVIYLGPIPAGQLGVSVVFDIATVVLFAIYLLQPDTTA